jgi:hypothetical protein
LYWLLSGDTVDKKIVKIVLERAKGYCEVCGWDLGEDYALHHRKLKSRGGKDSVSNLMAVHHKCHNLGTDSIHFNPERATEKGYMVSAWSEPHQIPVKQPDGKMVYFDDNGQKVEAQ